MYIICTSSPSLRTAGFIAVVNFRGRYLPKYGGKLFTDRFLKNCLALTACSFTSLKFLFIRAISFPTYAALDVVGTMISSGRKDFC